ncbi:MAG: SDR family NAD(P)-dependent oxidoreductase [Acidimicrobiales bacterium]|jgi:NAD(P)-dependent dehydrogenase (short-subunit alcohol dehydrogenase family)
MDQLNGKVAVVTGGASGIGLALGHAFANEGMKVVLADIEQPALEQAGKELAASGAEVHTVVCDVGDQAAVDRLRDEVVEAFGTAHVVCNNAGVGGGGPSWEIPLATWHWVIDVNMWGVVHGIRSFVPLLLEQGEGHIVNTASAAGLLTVPYMGPYAATKHAVVAITEGLSVELELAGGTVGASVLCPMWVHTRIHESDRNAPPDVLALPVTENIGTVDMRAVITAMVEGGLAPEVVAGKVVEAVKGKRFYVLPHEDVKASVIARAQRIANDESPMLALPGPDLG